MTDIEEAARSIAIPAWGHDLTERALSGFQRKVRRQRQLARASTALGVLVLAGTAGLLGARLVGAPADQVVRAPSRPPAGPLVRPMDRIQRLADGSLAIAVGQGSRVEVLVDGRSRARARVAEGRGRFRVTRNPAREFRVEAGAVAVTALGTTFDVTHVGGGVAVSVEEGRVRVDWPAGSRELAAGEAARFGPEQPSAARTEARPARRADRPAWVALARARKFEESYTLLERAPPAAEWSPEELMLAADAARLSGRPGKATPYLERLLRLHRGDERAPLAAFMLGRMLLHQLGAPSAAAARFAEARTLAPSSTLAEDALAREVEAWARAGQSDRARERAQEYLRLHPHGTRAEAVRQHAR